MVGLKYLGDRILLGETGWLSWGSRMVSLKNPGDRILLGMRNDGLRAWVAWLHMSELVYVRSGD